MATLYKGKEKVEIPYPVDIRDWKNDGWSETPPKTQTRKKKED